MKNKLQFVSQDLDMKFLKFYTAYYLNEETGKQREYFFASRNSYDELAAKSDIVKANAVEMFTYIKENDAYKIVMVKEFRPAINKYVYAFAAGLIDGNETRDEAAKREIKEELGGTVKSIDWCYDKPLLTSAGLSDEANYLAIVELEALNEQHLEDSEEIEVKKYTVSEVKEMLAKGEIQLTLPGYLGLNLLINRIGDKNGVRS